MVLAGFPEALVSVDEQDGAARIELDEALYPVDALYGAAYIFIDRCFVLLDRPSEGRLRATLSPKTAGLDLAPLVGEFANELLSCAWRHRITADNRAILETVTTQAMAGALGPPTLDDLASFDFSSEALEDPLGIAMSWEERYKKKEPAAPAAPVASSSEAEAPPALAPAVAEADKK